MSTAIFQSDFILKMATAEDIKNYYDAHSLEKVGGFINGNERIERAWETMVHHVKQTKRSLEVGCGIGDICWRMSKQWKDSEVIGIDISDKSIEFATRLFGSEKVKFIQGVLEPGTLKGKFDLIVLMDVFEHIEARQRHILYSAIKDLLSDEGVVFLSFPTPKFLGWLKINSPQHIQPVDEDITIETIVEFGKATGRDVLLYKEVSVWYRGDYAHTVLGNRHGWLSQSDRVDRQVDGVKDRIRKMFSSSDKVFNFSKKERIEWVKNRLGASNLDKIKTK
jgi:cyclopropane fatty-acyl-phospholipid synthase-like methyltransferase